MTKVRVRFAPSPTGFLHVGGLRTALFNFLFARKQGGAFILRIEDTDQSREVPGATDDIKETLKLFHLDWDEGPFFQSQRLEIYREHAEILLQKNAAYKCYCSEERLNELRKQAELQKIPFRYDKHCLTNPPPSLPASLSLGEAGNPSHRGRETKKKEVPPPKVGEERWGGKFVIRQNVPEEGSTEFLDEIHGTISVENRLLDDGILIKSDGWPVYNFANVVDDHLMEISHVIRGEEFIPSTPKHALLYSAFGWQPPRFAHLPLLLDQKRQKLSKRAGDVAVKDYLAKGYLPEAILNFIVFLGWNPKSDREFFSLEELCTEFDLKKVNKAGAVFDLDKLRWFNAHYLKNRSIRELTELARPFMNLPVSEPSQNFLQAIVAIERERLTELQEIGARIQYFFADPDYSASLLTWKNMPSDQLKAALQEAKQLIQKLSDGSSAEQIQNIFFAALGNGDKGVMLWPLRVALTGLEASPGPFEIIAAFLKRADGHGIVLNRIDKAIAKL